LSAIVPTGKIVYQETSKQTNKIDDRFLTEQR
jgi:hypothetical protein